MDAGVAGGVAVPGDMAVKRGILSFDRVTGP